MNPSCLDCATLEGQINYGGRKRVGLKLMPA